MASYTLNLMFGGILAYLEYWTLLFGPRMVYPKVLYLASVLGQLQAPTCN